MSYSRSTSLILIALMILMDLIELMPLIVLIDLIDLILTSRRTPSSTPKSVHRACTVKDV